MIFCFNIINRDISSSLFEFLEASPSLRSWLSSRFTHIFLVLALVVAMLIAAIILLSVLIARIADVRSETQANMQQATNNMRNMLIQVIFLRIFLEFDRNPALLWGGKYRDFSICSSIFAGFNQQKSNLFQVPLRL